MALNPGGLGAATPWTSSVVSQRQIDMLCSCFEDYTPLFLDEEIANASANNGVVAPPTFVNCFRDYKTVLLISELGVDMPMLLHGEQVIHFYKPVRPGDTVWHRVKIVDMGRKKSATYTELSYFTVLITLKNDQGEKLVEATQFFSYVTTEQDPAMEKQDIPYTKRVSAPESSVVTPRDRGPYFENVQVGFELVLQKPPITRLQIAHFANASGDMNPSHVDEDMARDVGKMGGVFAHGMLGMGMVGQVLSDYLWDRPLRLFSARATILVRPGDSLTCFAKVTRKWIEEDDNLVEFEVGARNQKGEITHHGKAVAVLPHRPIAVHPGATQEYLLQHRIIG